ncbi:MAG: hypothetical protein HBSAPP02_21150 [Phycisphaerae bacterium]|nr:MAG: fibronectin type III domain-containing protein [Planctomycetia bacterium]RIK67974.1 MAG: hypothetical protein DCC66_11025 [Planctomycetota bacterium]GJQ27083.1 MAG: hypothetical protein HBSAPP02_21150 [Phycisphaerae bacterium]
MRKPLPAVVAFIFVVSAFSGAIQANPNPPVDESDGYTVTGERLDETLIGPWIIESNEEVIARDQAMPPSMRNPKARNGEHGQWIVPTPRAVSPTGSGNYNITNKWGDTRMGIGFPRPVRLLGAHLGGQTNLSVTTPGLRVVGYLQGKEVGRTELIRGLTLAPQWFDFNMDNVDRIVFEAEAAQADAGWFTLDDLTYVDIPAPGEAFGQATIIDFDDLRYNYKLTGSGYRGLTWEEGSGPIPEADPVDANILPAPAAPVDRQPVDASSNTDNESAGEFLLRGGGSGPTLLAGYQGVFSGSDPGANSIPPDTCGAIGPSHFVEVINTSYVVFNKSNGAKVQSMSLTSFFNGSGQGFTGGDPRVIYDTHSGRWIVIGTNFNGVSPATIHIAVSTTSSATGSYFKTFFVAAAGTDAACWVDYPTLGVDANGIYIGAYMVGCGLTIFAIDKAPLVAGTGMGTVTAFRGISTGEVTLQAAQVYGTPVTPGGYIISTPSASSSSIRFRRVNPPISSPTLTTVATVAVNSYSSPPDAPASGSSTPLDTVGSRIMNALFRNGFFYATHCINVGGRAAVRWYKFQLNASSPFITLNQQGNVSDATLSYFFPSVSVNDNGHMVLGFSGSSPSQFAGAYYCGRLVNDPAGQTTAPALLKSGNASYQVLDGVGRNRWGDYSLTSVDPSDNDTLWTVQEYVHAGNTWGTWLGKFTFAPVDLTPPLPDPMSFSIAPTTVSTSSVYMQATEATDTDSPPVNYYFDYVSGAGGHDSIQASRDYTDTALPLANSNYTYRVAARDSATPNFNQTGFSVNAAVSTAIETPTGVSFGTITDTSVVVNATGSFSNLGFLQTGMFYEMTPAAGSGANVWVTGAGANSITVTGLAPCTQYGFRVKARNFQGIETGFDSASPTLVLTTGCGDCALLGDLNLNGAVEGGDIAGFVGAKLGSPVGGTNPQCAEYGGTLEQDIDAFVADLLATS